jgi:hypothetical protein
MAAAITHAHRTGQELHLLTCDLAKAFDETPKAALLGALARHGYPTELIRRVKVMQTCTGARARTRYGVSATEVVICKQGCPLSPILYCLFTDMLIRGLHSSPIQGYQITNSLPDDATGSTSPPTLDHQGYLDDLALFASSATASTSQLAYANDFLRAYGMRFNIGKCRHTVANPSPESSTRVTLNTGWSPATPGGTAMGAEIPRTKGGDTFLNT